MCLISFTADGSCLWFCAFTVRTGRTPRLVDLGALPTASPHQRIRDSELPNRWARAARSSRLARRSAGGNTCEHGIATRGVIPASKRWGNQYVYENGSARPLPHRQRLRPDVELQRFRTRPQRADRRIDFREKVAGLSDIHLVQQGGELAYLLRHDPEFRCVRREDLVEAGKQVRLKQDIKRFVESLEAASTSYRFSFYVISAAPRGWSSPRSRASFPRTISTAPS